MSESYLTQLDACPESLPGEKWRPVNLTQCPEASDFYLVSSAGRVLSKNRFNSYRKTSNPLFYEMGWHLLSQTIAGQGYRYVKVHVASGFKKTLSVHRLVAISWSPNPHGHSEVNHIDGDKENNTANNLEWCTRSENIRHSFATGLRLPGAICVPGEGNPGSKLTDLKVKEIRGLRKAGIMPGRLAKRYGVNLRNIHRVITRELWGHVN